MLTLLQRFSILNKCCLNFTFFKKSRKIMHYKFHKIDDIDNKKCFLLTKLE